MDQGVVPLAAGRSRVRGRVAETRVFLHAEAAAGEKTQRYSSRPLFFFFFFRNQKNGRGCLDRGSGKRLPFRVGTFFG